MQAAVLLLAVDGCGRAVPATRGELQTSTGRLGFATGSFYLRRRTDTLRLVCPAGGGGAGSSRQRWCFSARALSKVGTGVTVVHEPPQRGAVLPVAVIHELRDERGSIVHDIR